MSDGLKKFVKNMACEGAAKLFPPPAQPVVRSVCRALANADKGGDKSSGCPCEKGGK